MDSMDYKMLFFSICQSVYELSDDDSKYITVSYLENYYIGEENKYTKISSSGRQIFDRIQINILFDGSGDEKKFINMFHDTFSSSLLSIFPEISEHTAVLFYKIGENIYPLLLRYKK